jgi:hypothetical protein
MHNHVMGVPSFSPSEISLEMPMLAGSGIVFISQRDGLIVVNGLDIH